MKCVHHDGVEGYEENRARIDPRLAELEVHQGGDMRHKCPYCAYKLGGKGWDFAGASGRGG